jgi:hypothetical protein
MPVRLSVCPNSFKLGSNFGADLYGVTDLTPTLDEVSGGLCVAQRVARSWLTVNGGLWYDPGYGEPLQYAINAPVYPARLAPRLRAQAERDECVESADIKISFTEATKTLEILATLILTDGSELRFSVKNDAVMTELLMGG